MGMLGTRTLKCCEATGYITDVHIVWEHCTEGYGYGRYGFTVL